jgi:hypothetical protein
LTARGLPEPTVASSPTTSKGLQRFALGSQSALQTTIFLAPRNRHRHHLSATLLDGRAGNGWARLLGCGRNRSDGGFPNAGYEPHPSCGDCPVTARSRPKRAAKISRKIVGESRPVRKSQMCCLSSSTNLGSTVVIFTNPPPRLLWIFRAHSTPSAAVFHAAARWTSCLSLWKCG